MYDAITGKPRPSHYVHRPASSMRSLKVIYDAEAYNQHLKATQKLDAEIKAIEKAAETKKTALQGLTPGGALYKRAQIEAEITRAESIKAGIRAIEKGTALQKPTPEEALWLKQQIDAGIERAEKKGAEEKKAMLNFLLREEEDAEWEVVAEDEEWEQVSKEEADDKRKFFSPSGLRVGDVRGGLQREARGR